MCRKFAIKVLEEKGEATIKCNGRSMVPMIYPQEPIHLKKVEECQLRIGDAVFVRIKGNLQVHCIGAIDRNRYRIENIRKFINGWVGFNSIYGLAVKVADRVLVSDEELEKRLKEKVRIFASPWMIETTLFGGEIKYHDYVRHIIGDRSLDDEYIIFSAERDDVYTFYMSSTQTTKNFDSADEAMKFADDTFKQLYPYIKFLSQEDFDRLKILQ